MQLQQLDGLVREALAGVIDPETGLSIMRMEIIQNLMISEDGSVKLVFRPSSPMCPMAYALGDKIKKALISVGKVSSITILVENFNDAERLQNLLR